MQTINNILATIKKQPFILGALVFVILVLIIRMKREGLSLSQFPIPTCSTNNSGTFYTCGGCGTYYQEQNKIGQACDCGGFTVYPTKVQPSCYRQTLQGRPDVGEIQTCTETLGGSGIKESCCGSLLERFGGPAVGSCSSCTGVMTCLEPGSTFESGSQERRNLPCPVPFPPVTSGYTPIAHKQALHTSELDVFQHLERGGLLIAANKGEVIEYTFKKLLQQTARGGNSGYPDFYYINGPILVMMKLDGVYYWMIDYPIKYNPGNYLNYVNQSDSWAIARTIYAAGKKLLNGNAPMIFYAPTAGASRLAASAAACMPSGQPQSSTDYYYPGCSQKSCLWGPDYGSGNWLSRV